MDFECKQTHAGQYQRYGSSYFEWDIITGESKEDTLKFCQTLKNGYANLPEKREWEKNIRINGEKAHDMRYYFTGCYSLEPTDTGYHFTVIKPYTD